MQKLMLQVAGNRDWDHNDERYDNVYRTIDPNDCTDGAVITHSLPQEGTDVDTFYVEHILELQTMQLFFDDIAKNGLPIYQTENVQRPLRLVVGSGFDQIYTDFFDHLKGKVLVNPPALQGWTQDDIVKVPMQRIMSVMGDRYNWQRFVLLEKNVNQVKQTVSAPSEIMLLCRTCLSTEQIWQGHMPTALEKLNRLNSDVNRYQEQLINMRTVSQRLVQYFEQ